MARTEAKGPASYAIDSLSDAISALRAGAKAGRPVRLMFSWTRLRAVGIGYAMAIVAKARAACPQVVCVTVLDAGEDAGLALSALRAGADLVLFSGAPQLAAKLSQIAAQMGVGLEFSPAT